MPMFTKILIANRGEIACRIIKTTKKMGIESVAIYSTADADSLHVTLADSAFCVGPPAASASYLNIDAIIAAAKTSGAEAIHPGYGFLSENPDFARACAKAKIVFIGPSVEAMLAMASKQLAKQQLEKTNIPLTPGYHGKEQSASRLETEAKRIGFPVLIKAASGGGGKGMRAVTHEADFLTEVTAARREAKAYFDDDTLLIEKLIMNPRHVEVQIMADNHGNVVHLYDRDCSIQRRHQKIIEEAPAPNLSATLRERLTEAAIAVARAIDYRGAGTVEFLVDGCLFYFMEMNTRLQVEHPVTEMITHLDLVEWQLRIAANEPLPCTQAEIPAQGHAIECRIYAEDPQNGFIPSIGQLHFLKEPTGMGIRVDSGVHRTSDISMYYDPMIAKLIAWGESRTEALGRLQQALTQYYIGGVKTNIPFLASIIQQPDFINAKLNTNFLSQHTLEMPTIDLRLAILMAASVDYMSLQTATVDPLLIDTFAWQPHLDRHWCSRYTIHGELLSIDVTPINAHELRLTHNNETLSLQIKWMDNTLSINDGNQCHQALIERFNDQIILYTTAGPITVERFDGPSSANHHHCAENLLTAPMPATVVAILKNKGDTIKAGDRLMVLEAMKMEHTIHAPADGLLVNIFYDIGAQVQEGAELVTVQTEG